MNKKYNAVLFAAAVALLCGLILFAFLVVGALQRFTQSNSTPTLDLFATLQAVSPAAVHSTPVISPTATSLFSFPSSTAEIPGESVHAAPTASPGDGLTGKIVFTCQVHKVQASNQICIINADGSGYRRLTTDDNRQHYYASLAPDGKSIVYAAFREENIYELYEMTLSSGKVEQLTDRLGVLNAPEISPNGEMIAFTRWTVKSNKYQIWLMDRNGENPNNIPKITGWDPTWSPNGKFILFASDMNGGPQLYTVKTNGGELRQVSNLPAIRGRSDWSPDGTTVVTYSGEPWKREVYLLNTDGSEARQLSPSGGNSQGPSFSPDGRWVVFTAYFDHPGDIHGCEIYVVRTDGTNLRRLTNNDYCDYQPRWGQ